MSAYKIMRFQSSLAMKFSLAIWVLLVIAISGCNADEFNGAPTATTGKPAVSPVLEVALPSLESSQAAPALTTTVEEVISTEEIYAPSGTQKPVYWFSEEDCACAAFPGEVNVRSGPGSLKCNYSWSGQHIENNSASINITQYNDQDFLLTKYNEESGWIRDASQSFQSMAATSTDPADTYGERDWADGFIFLATYPSSGSLSGGDIPMCSAGSGVFLAAGEFLVKIQLDSCDLGEARELYQAALDTLEACALSSIEKALSANP